MKYLWTEDTGAGFHYWQLVNKYLFQNELIVESKDSNQGILDAVRFLTPVNGDTYYIAFDIVYDNMDVVNKYQELLEIARKHSGQIMVLDMTCFEHVILSFCKLIEWTGSGKADKLAIREDVLGLLCDHRINLVGVMEQRTKDYLMGFKKFSTERVIKSLVAELTENDMWSVKGRQMGGCWYEDCCILQNQARRRCGVGERKAGEDKIKKLLYDTETQRLIKDIQKF